VPPLARRFVKTAIVFLIFGVLLGLHLGAAEYCGWGLVRQPYIVAHTHVILIGFLLMLIMGVAAWMFPRPAAGRPAREGLAVFAWWALTVGVVVRTSGEIVSAYWPSQPLGIAIFTAASLEAVGIILFFAHLWPRIRSPREELDRQRAG